MAKPIVSLLFAVLLVFCQMPFSLLAGNAEALGQGLYNEGQYTLAAEKFKQAMQEAATLEEQIAAQYELATALLAANLFDEALDNLLEISPQTPQNSLLSRQIHMSIATASLKLAESSPLDAPLLIEESLKEQQTVLRQEWDLAEQNGRLSPVDISTSLTKLHNNSRYLSFDLFSKESDTKHWYRVSIHLMVYTLQSMDHSIETVLKNPSQEALETLKGKWSEEIAQDGPILSLAQKILFNNKSIEKQDQAEHKLRILNSAHQLSLTSIECLENGRLQEAKLTLHIAIGLLNSTLEIPQTMAFVEKQQTKTLSQKNTEVQSSGALESSDDDDDTLLVVQPAHTPIQGLKPW